MLCIKAVCNIHIFHMRWIVIAIGDHRPVQFIFFLVPSCGTIQLLFYDYFRFATNFSVLCAKCMHFSIHGFYWMKLKKEIFFWTKFFTDVTRIDLLQTESSALYSIGWKYFVWIESNFSLILLHAPTLNRNCCYVCFVFDVSITITNVINNWISFKR